MFEICLFSKINCKPFFLIFCLKVIIFTQQMTGMITVECSDGTLIDVDKEMAISMSGAIRKRLGKLPKTI